LDQVPAAARALIGAGRLHRWSRELLGEGGGQGLLRDAETVLATARGLVRISGTILGGAAVFLFLGVYVAAQPAVYRRGLLRLVPLPARPRAEEVVSATVVSLRRWLFGRVVAMCFVGLGVTLGLWLIGIQAALALGLLAGLLTFVEYIGAIVSVVPPLLIGATHGWSTVFWILVLFGAAHAVEGYLLTPLLARRTVRFPPGLTLAVQLLFGLFFGAPGLMLATPTSVVVARLVEMLYIEDVLHDRPAGSRA
ncbi:MAG TPA: AI-2E family transporter, partial [Polyangia bacterium]|nr:AI-2E family transporter [Polyangia bacterium]